MPPRRKQSSKPNLGLDCGLSIPKFLQPYQDMLGENSVFKDQVRKQREEAWENEQVSRFQEQLDKKDKNTEQKQPVGNSAHMTEEEKEKVNRIMSNSNSDIVRELSQKLVNGSSKTEEKKPINKEEKKEKTTTKIMSVGSKQMKKKPQVNKPAVQNQKKGMLSFDLEDSDE